MKDVPSHLAKFLKKVAKEESEHGEEEIHKAQKIPPSKDQIKKQKKLEQKKEQGDHIIEHDSEETRNRKLKKRGPVFRKKYQNKSMK